MKVKQQFFFDQSQLVNRKSTYESKKTTQFESPHRSTINAHSNSIWATNHLKSSNPEPNVTTARQLDAMQQLQQNCTPVANVR